MKLRHEIEHENEIHDESGKVKTGILLWALGVPLPFILLFVLLRGCF